LLFLLKRLKLEQILEDLTKLGRPSYEAELLHSIIALIQKMSTIPHHKTEASSQIEACMNSLVMLGMKFFHFNKDKPENIANSRKSARFHSKYASLFKSDFLESNSQGTNGDKLVDTLQKWKHMLEIGISFVPEKSMLQEVSPSLSWFSSQAPDLWAGACESKSLTTSNSQHDASLNNALDKAKRSSALAAVKTNSQAVLVAANLEGLGGHTGGGAAVVEIPAQKLRIEEEKALVAAQMTLAPKRVKKRLEPIGSGKTVSWLTVVPERRNDTLLSMEEIQDNPRLRYGMRPIGLPERCNGCGEGFLVDHALKCRKGGLVCIWHNDVRNEAG
jgi:hypothetical protein